MYTTRELNPLHDRQALLSVDSLRVLVNVLDTRQVFARVDCLVSPVNGAGQQWVSVDRLSQPQGSNHANTRTNTRCIQGR